MWTVRLAPKHQSTALRTNPAVPTGRVSALQYEADGNKCDCTTFTNILTPDMKKDVPNASRWIGSGDACHLAFIKIQVDNYTAAPQSLSFLFFCFCFLPYIVSKTIEWAVSPHRSMVIMMEIGMRFCKSIFWTTGVGGGLTRHRPIGCMGHGIEATLVLKSRSRNACNYGNH